MLALRQLIDPRIYQASVQLGLLLWGQVSGYFALQIQAVVGVAVVAMGLQWLLCRWQGVSFTFLSSINTSLSILLLLNASHYVWLVFASALAIVSKFVIRWQGRHVFNPSNIAIVVLLLASDMVWVTPGKWGQGLWLALLVAAAGLVVILGWRPMLTSLSFLACYSAILIVRAMWLGDPMAIPLHQLQSGALLIFTFFMLSDPMTTPVSAWGRVLFGCTLAVLASWLQFVHFLPNAFLYALALMSPWVPVVNAGMKGDNYVWMPRRQL